MINYKLGVDIGGTFTDFSVLNLKSNELIVFKVPSTPKSPAKAVKNGLEILKNERDIDPKGINHFVHGTTIPVNTLIQKNGANLSLFATDGFADLLEIQRLRLPDIYAISPVRPKPLIPREQCMQIKERIRFDGSIEILLDKNSVFEAIQKALSQRVEGVVICFINSYRNPEHELLVQDMISGQDPQLIVTCSSEVWPQLREYERAMVAVINAYVRPQMESYLTELQGESIFGEAGIKVTPYITKSNGGIMNVREAKTRGAETLLSGTASGVVGASYIAGIAGFKDIITFDMGGTSSDIALVSGGQPHYSTEEFAGEFPIIMPAIAVSSVGSGGGSIAYLDKSGVLKVGPESAGADPGPACYGIGGDEPTITDAYLLCGFINPNNFAFGQMKLHKNLAEKAIGTIAVGLGMDIYSVAQAIIEVSTATMYAGLNKAFSRRGIDPRVFTLVPFGGAGPTHFCFLAREFHINKSLIPNAPGTLSALGALCSDVKTEFIKSIRFNLAEVDVDQFRGDFEALKTQASNYLAKEGFVVHRSAIYMSVDMNYIGQSFQVEVPIEENWLSSDSLSKIETGFHQVHHRIYGHSDENAPAEIMNLKVTAIGLIPKPTLKKLSLEKYNSGPVASRTIYYDKRMWKANIYNRKNLHWGSLIDGPAVIEQDDSTIILIDNFMGNVDQYGNIIVKRKKGY